MRTKRVRRLGLKEWRGRGRLEDGVDDCKGGKCKIEVADVDVYSNGNVSCCTRFPRPSRVFCDILESRFESCQCVCRGMSCIITAQLTGPSPPCTVLDVITLTSSKSLAQPRRRPNLTKKKTSRYLTAPHTSFARSPSRHRFDIRPSECKS
jgi:hypothetical protein